MEHATSETLPRYGLAVTAVAARRIDISTLEYRVKILKMAIIFLTSTPSECNCPLIYPDYLSLTYTHY